MKNIILTVTLIISTISTASSQFSFGAGLNYYQDLGVSVRASTNVANLNLVPKFTYFFVEGATVTSFDLDANFDIVSIKDNPISLFVGPALYRVSSNGDADSRLGINGGVALRVSQYYGEIRYTGIFCEDCGGEIGFAAGYYF